MMITFSIEPGIIPARQWGATLPAKYKSVDVMKI
jgi:hypothetical protein